MAVKNAVDVLASRIKSNREMIGLLKLDAKESEAKFRSHLVAIGEFETENKNFEKAIKKLTESKQEVINNIDKE